MIAMDGLQNKFMPETTGIEKRIRLVKRVNICIIGSMKIIRLLIEKL